jgi:hypothetical protein
LLQLGLTGTFTLLAIKSSSSGRCLFPMALLLLAAVLFFSLASIGSLLLLSF